MSGAQQLAMGLLLLCALSAHGGSRDTREPTPRSETHSLRVPHRDRDTHSLRVPHRDRDTHSLRVPHRDRDTHSLRDRDTHSLRVPHRDRDTHSLRPHAVGVRHLDRDTHTETANRSEAARREAPTVPRFLRTVGTERADTPVEISVREIRKKEKFIKHFTGPLYFSPKCRKHVYRLYHSTRDCTTPTYFKRCARLLRRLAGSPQCSDG